MTADPTLTQVSSGGVAFRRAPSGIEVALISVGAARRWQLPKGRLDGSETPLEAAQREVREEAGLETEPVGAIDRIDYWFYTHPGGKMQRVHKYVHFFLLRYLSGDPSDHDHEVNEARWVPIEDALKMLTFKNEVQILHRAQEMLAASS